MQATASLQARARYRQAGRHVLRSPGDWAAHEAHVATAGALDGTEPLQGAIVDCLHACAPAPDRLGRLLAQPLVSGRLAPPVLQTLAALARSGRRLPRITPLATRYCILASPSLDVPSRAVLCGVDDSRGIAQATIPRLLQGDAVAEEAFLQHCEGARDTLAFMLARRALTRSGRVLAQRWDAVAMLLEKEVSA